MHDRVALVTGGGTGIGAATAVRLAAAGARVMICGRREAPLRETRTRAQDSGGQVEVVTCDLEAPGSAATLVEAVQARWGRLDILVNNAAFYEPQSAVDTSRETWARHHHLNVTVPFELSVAAHPSLREAGGVIVNVLSNLALRPVPGTAAYSSSKAALASVTKTLALEWAADGVRAVGLSVGVVDTPLHTPERLADMAPAHPLGRCGRPEEVADAIAFLASDASAWTTGAILSVDGGLGLA